MVCIKYLIPARVIELSSLPLQSCDAVCQAGWLEDGLNYQHPPEEEGATDFSFEALEGASVAYPAQDPAQDPMAVA